MKEIDLRPYDVPGGKFEPKFFLPELLLSPMLKLTGVALLDHFKLADKIRTAGDSILLDEQEYNKVKQTTQIPAMAGANVGFGRNEVELMRRILEAPEVEVEKKNG